MSNILEKIIENKRVEVEQRKISQPVSQLMKMEFYNRVPINVRTIFNSEKLNIIAEYKRQSPSKGIINANASVIDVVTAYQAAGATAISVLTDEKYFGGTLKDLTEARRVSIPLLRKDFIIDHYQIVESKAYGADIILLIAACLQPIEIKEFAAIAKSMGLNTLLEIHSEDELMDDYTHIDMIGINNRNLKNFEVNLGHSIDLSKKLPSGIIRIAESGINDLESIKLLVNEGFNGFLIGEMLMKTNAPGKALDNLFNDFKKENA